MEALRVARVLPGLVDEPALRAAPVLDEAVAVEVAVLVDPGERAQRGLPEVADERRVARPAPDLGEEDEVERRRVNRAVVAREPRFGSLAVAHLVDDLAGLGVDRRVVLGRLQRGEDTERVVRELRPEEERLQARDQRVAAEDRHEPGHPRGRKLAGDTRVLVHPQRREVGDRLRERRRQLLPRGPQLRHGEVPRRERGADARELVSELPLRLRDRDPDPSADGMTSARRRHSCRGSSAME